MYIKTPTKENGYIKQAATRMLDDLPNSSIGNFLPIKKGDANHKIKIANTKVTVTATVKIPTNVIINSSIF